MEFNEVIWKAVRGEDSVIPPPRRAAFLVTVHEEGEENE
jgi:hypothetical protein